MVNRSVLAVILLVANSAARARVSCAVVKLAAFACSLGTSTGL